MQRFTANDIFNHALRPSTWDAWIPADIQEKIPLNVSLMISCIDGIWIFTNLKCEVLWSSAPVEIWEPKVLDLMAKMFAMVAPQDAA